MKLEVEINEQKPIKTEISKQDLQPKTKIINKKLILLVFVIFLLGIGAIITYYLSINPDFSLKNLTNNRNTQIPEQTQTDQQISKEDTTILPKADIVEDTTTVKPNPQPVPTPIPNSTSNWWEYPTEILPVTKDPNNALVLVNKKYTLPNNYTPSDLVDTSTAGYNGGYLVRAEIVQDLSNLRTDAEIAGYKLGIQSAFRSYESQENAYNYWLNFNNGSVIEADKVSARPGHSQHQLGTAVDFNLNVEGGVIVWEDFNSTQACTWLKENAWKYGFVLAYPEGKETETGYAYEGWHFRWIGAENANEWSHEKKALDIWLTNI